MTGALAGYSEGSVLQCFATGAIEGNDYVGGLIGRLYEGGQAVQCYTVSTVSGSAMVGGFAGYNRGAIRNSYAVSRVSAVRDRGGVIGYLSYVGTVDASFWDVTASGLTFSDGGEGKTSAEMRCQATYAGWDFGTTWGIQEGVGTPYLRQFAVGQTNHLASAATVYPANLSFIWPLRPVLTSSVELAGCDIINARWQIATSEDFSDARDWLGLADDGDPLRAPFSSRVPIECALNYGELYYWRVCLQTAYGMWSGWSEPAMFLVWEPVNPVAAGKDELSVWSEGLLSSLWRPDYLLAAHDDFAAAIQKSGTNEEARIFHAFTALATLSENSELRGLLADFGYSFDEGLFALTGRFAEAASPLPNDAVDRLVGQALPVIDQAAADLAVVPTNWTGSVALTPDVFPIDEAVYVDLGDVLLARAALAGARAAAETAQAYDLTLDTSKTNIYLPCPVAMELAVALDGDASEWTNTPAVLFGGRAQLEYAKIARSPTQVYLLAQLADGVTPQNLWAEFSTEDDGYGIWFESLSEGVPVSDWSGQATAYYAGNVIEIACDLPLAALGQDIHLSDISVEFPNPKPAPPPELAVTVDGDASEWTGVAEYPLEGKRGVIGSVKLAVDGTNICTLLTLQSGTFDTLSYFWLELADYTGNNRFSCYSGSSQTVYAWQGSVLEVSCPIPESLLETPLLLSYAEVEMEVGDGWYFDYYLWFDWTSGDNASREVKMQPVNQFLADQPACLNTVRNPDRLPVAKASLREALTLALEADEALTNRTDGLMHFFEYDPVQSNEQAEVRQRLREALASLDAPQHVAYAGREADVHVGAFYDSSFLPRAMLPRLTDDDEIIVGTFPDPTFNGILPDMTQMSWQDELLGFVPLAKENAFTMDGLTFTTGGYAFWEEAEGFGSHTNVAQSGHITNACASWVETTLAGPGTLDFSWAVSSRERVDILSVIVDGVRQTGSISGEPGWGPRQLVLAGGVHRVRWAYVRNGEAGSGADAGFLDDLSWSASGPTSTDTPVRVPYAWLDQFDGLVQGGDYDGAAWGDQDGDGKKTWEEYVTGTSPTNAASVFLATIGKGGPSLVIGWTPDLGPQRVYTVEGKAGLSEAEWAETNAASRFFRVKVQMP